MSKLKYLLFSLFYCIYASIASTAFLSLTKNGLSDLYDKFIRNLNMISYSYMECIQIGILVFIYLLSLSITIYSIYKALYNICVFYYFLSGPNIKYDSVEIQVDENNTIRKSVMVFSDGIKIPIHIERIYFHMDNLREEQENGEEET